MSESTAAGGFGRGLFLLVRRSMRQHALSTAVTAFSAALATGLALAVFGIQAQTERAFTGGDVGFDAVLGARGSKLQLVLNTVYHLETSPGNIPWTMFKEIERDPQVKVAIPYAVGDNYYGYRIVGTSEEIFTKFEFSKGHKFEFASGGRFDAARRSAVVGSFAAEKLKLKVGDEIMPFHGLVYAPGAEQHPEKYKIAGILKPTNSPSDRVIWIPIEGVFRMTGHALRGSGETYQAKAGESIPDANKEVSAVMLKFSNDMAGMRLDQTINKQGRAATLAWPVANVMSEIFQKLGWMSKVLILFAYLVVVVAAGSILASVYNSINERRREFAILRSLGARKRTVFAAIVLESATIAALGALGGYLVYAGLLSVATVIIRTQTGVVLNPLSWHPVLVLAPLGMTAMGAVAGIIPAIKAYSTDVATNIAPSS